LLKETSKHRAQQREREQKRESKGVSAPQAGKGGREQSKEASWRKWHLHKA